MKRRNFLLNGLAVASLAGGLHKASYAAPSEAEYLFTPVLHPTCRVRIEMELKGNIDLAKNELVSKERVRQLPIAYDSVLDYEERLSLNDDQKPRGARRYYHTAMSQGTTSGTPSRLELRDSAKHTAVHLTEGRSVSYAASAYLTHEEVSLLEIPVNSLVIDQALPAAPLAIGAEYKLDTEVLRQLLDMDAIQEQDVVSKLVSVDDKSARFEWTGTVQGSTDGVPTVIDLAGKITFDRKAKFCSWVAIALRERRQIGKAKPGFELSATIKVLRKPLTDVVTVLDKPLGDTPKPAQLLVNLYSTAGRYGVLMDRRWQMISQASSLSTMRMVDQDRDIAQCDVRHLPSLDAGRQLTLEALQADIKKSLGEQFREWISASELANGSDLRIARAHAMGVAEGVPVHWVFAHCSDDSGRRILATFTLAADNQEAFAGADEQFVQSLRFLTVASPSTDEEQEEEGDAAAKADTQAASRPTSAAKTQR